MRSFITTYVKLYYKTIYSISAFRNHILCFLAVVVLLYAFLLSSQYKKTPVVYAHMLGMSIAISNMEYGLTEYRGYKKIQQLFTPFYRKYGYATDFSQINEAIEKALKVNNVESEGMHLMSNDMGIVDFYRLGFRIFGYTAESTFYLFHMLFGLSVIAFMVTFFKRHELLFILLLFVCSYLVVIQTPELKIESLTDARFYTILTLLPSFYLALLFLRKRRFDIIALAGSIVQVFILIFAIHGRSPGINQIAFLAGLLLVIFAFSYLIRKENIKKIVLSRICVWPLVILFIGLVLLKMHLAINLNHAYTSVTAKHPFWHSVYLGLGDHPDSKEIIGFDTYNNDRKGFELVERLAPQKGLTFDIDSAIYNYEWSVPPDNDKEIRFLDDNYEAIVKEEILRIFKENPGFVINSFLYKIPLFLKVYFGSSDIDYLYLPAEKRYYTFGALPFVIKGYLLLIVFSGALLVRRVPINNWLICFGILILQFVFALIPALLGTPGSQIIVDSGLLFTILIYMVLTFPIFLYYSKGLSSLLRVHACRKFANLLRNLYTRIGRNMTSFFGITL